MAEEESKAESNSEDNGGSKKKLIVIIIAAVIAVIAAVGVTVFLLVGDSSEEKVDETVEVIEEPLAPASYSNLTPPFLVTFDVDGRQRYMQLSVTASSRDTSALDALEHHKPLIRSKVISAYNGLDFASIQTEEGKEALRLQTVNVINTVLEAEGAAAIENIFFTNFVLQ